MISRSLRWIARRIGFCGVIPMRCNIREFDVLCRTTPNTCSVIITDDGQRPLLRTEVHLARIRADGDSPEAADLLLTERGRGSVGSSTGQGLSAFGAESAHLAAWKTPDAASRTPPRDPQYAWTRRMMMLQLRWRGVAHKELAERAAGAERARH